MTTARKRKIVNDPVFGFINIPDNILFEIIQHKFFQRLHRVKQLGLSSHVYPGAQHTRMQHSMGAMHLMGEAINQLRQTGAEISDEEELAVRACILLHDIGHGPFSHALEHSLVTGISHEEISLLLMNKMNVEFGGALDMTISIFKNEYPKRFLHQLVSGQLDMDRLDYLSRDSFFCGVSEGVIGAARIIKMLNIHNDQLVVEAKGIYSIEKFLVARRLMYWQVYLHKTSVAAEFMLVNILRRAKELASKGLDLFATPALKYFLYNTVDRASFLDRDESIEQFIRLDDSDLISAFKVWCDHEDKILSILCKGMIHRKLFKVEIRDEKASEETLDQLAIQYISKLGVKDTEIHYLMGDSMVTTDTYSPEDDNINILYKDGTIKDISVASDMLNIQVLTKKVRKNFFCYYNIR